MTLEAPADDAKRDHDSAWAEYKILQDKIDRIGDFQFRIKGWAVTIVLGLLVAVKNVRLSTWQFVIAGVTVLAAFWVLEWLQQRLQGTFARRLAELESHMRPPMRSATSRRRLRSKHEFKRSPAIAWSVGRSFQETTPCVRRLEHHSSSVFYGVIAAVFIGTALIGDEQRASDGAVAEHCPGAGGVPGPRAAPDGALVRSSSVTFATSTGGTDADAGASEAICR